MQCFRGALFLFATYRGSLHDPAFPGRDKRGGGEGFSITALLSSEKLWHDCKLKVVQAIDLLEPRELSTNNSVF